MRAFPLQHSAPLPATSLTVPADSPSRGATWGSWKSPIRAALSLLAGVCITVLIAWSTPLWDIYPARDVAAIVHRGDPHILPAESRSRAEATESTAREPAGLYLSLRRDHLASSTLAIASTEQDWKTADMDWMIALSALDPKLALAAPLPPWSRPHLIGEDGVNLPAPPPANAPMPIATRVLRSSGWPLRAFWCEAPILQGKFANATSPGGFVIAGKTDKVLANDIPRVVPFRPLWPGLLVNSLVFASAAWLCVGVISRTTKLWRDQKYRCPRCGFDRRGSETRICAECGFDPRASAQNQRTA